MQLVEYWVIFIILQNASKYKRKFCNVQEKSNELNLTEELSLKCIKT